MECLRSVIEKGLQVIYAGEGWFFFLEITRFLFNDAHFYVDQQKHLLRFTGPQTFDS